MEKKKSKNQTFFYVTNTKIVDSKMLTFLQKLPVYNAPG